MLTTTEEAIQAYFDTAVGKEGAVERVKKIRDYAFVHFRDRDDAVTAMDRLNGKSVKLLLNYVNVRSE